MYTYRVNIDDKIIFGPICHNYATAIENAKNHLNKLKSEGYSTDDIPDIQKPFKVQFLCDNLEGFIEVGKIIFVDLDTD